LGARCPSQKRKVEEENEYQRCSYYCYRSLKYPQGQGHN
jgi:hypothetical protein